MDLENFNRNLRGFLVAPKAKLQRNESWSIQSRQGLTHRLFPPPIALRTPPHRWVGHPIDMVGPKAGRR